MGMFSWRLPDGHDPSSRASPDFWIYWAVAIPLTVITIAGWATWWKVEMRRSDGEVPNMAPVSLMRRHDQYNSNSPSISV